MPAALQSLVARARSGTCKPQRSGFFRREKRSESKPIEGCSNGASTVAGRVAGRSFVAGFIGAVGFIPDPGHRTKMASPQIRSYTDGGGGRVEMLASLRGS